MRAACAHLRLHNARREMNTHAPGALPQMLVMGAAQLCGPGAPVFAPERRYQMLGVLALRSGEWVARDELATLLWPERTGADARRNLRHVVFKARALPGVQRLEVAEHALRWDVRTDLLAFEHAVADGRLAEALAWRRAPALAGIEDAGSTALAEWLAERRAQIDARWQQVGHDALEAEAAPHRRIELALRLLAFDPLDETAVGAWVQSELELGNEAAAQRLYRDYALRLAEEFGIEPSRRLRDLLGLSVTPAAAPGLAERLAEPSGFVGRALELNELARLLAEPGCRLVTLVGPGGIGKSRLAAQALQRLAPPAPAMTAWIELQDLGDCAALAARLAQRLGVSIADARDPMQAIARGIGPLRVVCVLDNAEHLEDLPSWIGALLAAAPSLVVLATSRKRLRIAAERPLALAGLPVPDEDSRDLEAASAFDAVRLFEIRAVAARRSFSLSRHLGAVTAIVEATGGMPLAIELAAAWVRLLPPEEIARELRASIDLLERDPAAPGEPARPEHGSLRAVLERGWQLLAPAEREVLAALSVFRGGFTRDAAAAVAAAPLPLLSSLADKGLLTVDDTGRFGMHPLVAADAAARLRLDPDRALHLSDRHAAHVADRLDACTRSAGADHAPVVEAVEAEFANALAAWEHAIARGSGDWIARSTQAWHLYFEARGQAARGAAHFRAALAIGDSGREGEVLGARLRAPLARLTYRQGEFDDSLALAQAGIELAAHGGDRRALAACLSHAGGALCALGHWGEARPLFDRALALARTDGSAGETGTALNNLGIVAKKEGRYDDALACFAQALAIERELGHHMAVVRCLNNLAGVHMERNEWLPARPYMQQGLRLSERHGLAAMTPYLAFGLGAVQLELGELDGAASQLRRAFELGQGGAIPVVAILAEANLARVAARRGDLAQAGWHLAGAAREASARGWTSLQLHGALFLGECCALIGQRERAARLWLMIAAHPQADAGLRDSALRWLDGLDLRADEQAAAQREPLDLDHTVACLLRGGDLPAGPAAIDKR